MERTSLRSLLMLGGAGGGGGAQIETGTFTAVQQTSNTYKIEFQKTYTSYVLYVEMTDESKASFMDSGQTGAKMFAFAGVYPTPKIEDANPNGGVLAYRINPSTEEYSLSQTTFQAIDGSSITLTCNGYSGGANILYKDLDYKYTVIPLD